MANKKYSDIDLTKYNSGYQESDVVKSARNQASTANNAYNSHINAGFTYSDQNWMNDIIESIKTRPDFQYDLNGDALYQQYKDKYIQQGKMAMADTMGQAAAMTGGYGSSYATTAGNQAYQASLENLNDIVPQLYQMAYDKYNNETQDLYNQYGLASDQRNFEYGQWTDKASMLDSDRSYYQTNYNNERTYDRNVYDSDRTHDTNQYWKETNYGYQQDRDTIADEQWQKSFDEGVRQYNESMAWQKEQALKGSTGGGGGGGGGGGLDLVETANTKNFHAAIKTKNEFYNRGGADKETYGTYENYIEGIIDKWAGEGKLDDNEVATLLVYYGLAD